MESVHALAGRVLELLDRGAFAATYKYAVLLSLLDLSFEQSLRNGVPPPMVTTRQLAEKVIELYWPQVRVHPGSSRILRQNNGNQARILSSILEFQRHGEPHPSLWRAKHRDAQRFNALVDEVEWTLIQMPLPKLQRVGNQYAPF